MSREVRLIDGVNVLPLIHCFQTFADFEKNISTDQLHTGAIKAFENCFELTWKTLRRFLLVRGVEKNAPREVLRESALEGFIVDPEIWYEFLRIQSLTVHTYEQEVAEEVASIFPAFLAEMHALFKVLKIDPSEAHDASN